MVPWPTIFDLLSFECKPLTFYLPESAIAALSSQTTSLASLSEEELCSL